MPFLMHGRRRVVQNAVTNNTPPRTFVAPAGQHDPDALYDLLETLQDGGLEIHRTEADFVADGVQFRQGDFHILASQPYGALAKALLHKTPYPLIKKADGSLRRPYDVSEHHLPSYLGVEVWPVDSVFDVAARRLERIERAAGTVAISPAGWYILTKPTQSSLPVSLDKECETLLQAQGKPGQYRDSSDSAAREFSGVGTVLPVLAETSHLLAHGARQQEAIVFFASPGFCLGGGRGILSYAEQVVAGIKSPGLSGRRRYALTEVPIGKGGVILFGFRPQFRGQFRATYKFLFNAIFYAAAKPVLAWPGKANE